MKLKDYLKQFNTLVENDPEALEYEVVCSSDEEGNSFNPVVYSPNTGHYDKNRKEFIPKDEVTDQEYNAICIN